MSYAIISYEILDPLHASDGLELRLFGAGRERRFLIRGSATVSLAAELHARQAAHQPFASIAEFEDLSRGLGLVTQET